MSKGDGTWSYESYHLFPPIRPETDPLPAPDLPAPMLLPDLVIDSDLSPAPAGTEGNTTTV
jgi:hypothetical protein